jgi:type I restriction enzyme S subunit
MSKLRFKGFLSTWQEINLGKFGSFFKGNSYGRDHISAAGENLILYGDLFTLYFGRIDRVINHTESVFDNAVYGEPGDLLFPGSTTVDALSLISPSALTKKSLLGGDVIAYRSKKISAIFLAFLILGRYRQEFAKKAQGTTIIHMYAKSLSEIPIMVPIDIQEQEKIGSFLSAIDRLIEKQKEKVKRIKFLKKGYLQKMFPVPGENVPKVSFNNLKGKWTERKVSDLFKITRGNVLAVSQVSHFKTEEKPFPVYSSQTSNNGLLGYFKDFLFEDAITWTTDGANAGTVKYRQGKFYSTNVNGVLLSEEGYANLAIAETLNKQTPRYVSHVGNPKLMNNVMGLIKIKIPESVNELNKISIFLTVIDNLIENEESAIERYKSLKKGYLQKIFAD